jgi:alcohol dehydrogenase (cytochrome c)
MRQALLSPLVALIAAAGQAQQPDGVYTLDQAGRGQAVYAQRCSQCHGVDLGGASGPALVGVAFGRTWGREGLTLDDLYYVLRTTMPKGVPGSLAPAEYLAVLAYLLQRNGYPAGRRELSGDQRQLHGVRLAAVDSSADSAARRPTAILTGHEPTRRIPTQRELDTAEANGRDWLYATHDYSGQRYSPLAVITSRTAPQLRPVCVYQVGDPGIFQTNPIVYHGTMYITTLHATIALDAATCRPRWKSVWEPKDREVSVRNRGVALKDGFVVRGTSDGWLVALDAATGALLWARQVADPAHGETFAMPPLLFEDLVLIGPAGSEHAMRGWVGAFRLRDGVPVWRFRVVPLPGEPGSETWPNPQQVLFGGGAVWTPMALDRARGLLFVATGNPSPDLSVAARPGASLYTNSIVVLDARTGAPAWAAQLVPGDHHDWDLTHASPLFRTTVVNRRRDLVATVGKDGVLRVLDRGTGERVYEVPITRRENTDAPVTTSGVHACPGGSGGVQWNGPAYNPRTNLLYVNAVDWCATFTAADTVRYVPGQLYLGGRVVADSLATARGWLTAVDATRGTVRWRYRSPLPLVAAVTTTAGGVVFTGELTGDFLVLDARSGVVRYRFNTGGPMGGGIVTYAVAGKQYVAAMSGRPASFWVGPHAGSATVLVFGLP